MKQIEKVSRRYDKIPYIIDGLGWTETDKGKVVYFKIEPSDILQEFRSELATEVYPLAPDTKRFDLDDNFLFHATIGYKLNDNEFKRVGYYLETNRIGQFYFPLDALRITLLDNTSKIICEYDLLQKKMLTRPLAKNREVWRKTFQSYRRKNGMELLAPIKHDGKQIFFISDLHLDHENIIRYCARPFMDVDAMNRVLVNNWNYTVAPSDTVYFLGDMSFGRNSHTADYWCTRLNGEIIFIRGNHDRIKRQTKDHIILEYNGIEFLLIHDPKDVPIDWSGWVIHGDKHNNDLRNYPFINHERRTINVSAEVIRYKPVSIDTIIAKMDCTITML
jgi:calcineurin-like phosphoesterase family protein